MHVATRQITADNPCQENPVLRSGAEYPYIWTSDLGQHDNINTNEQPTKTTRQICAIDIASHTFAKNLPTAPDTKPTTTGNSQKHQTLVQTQTKPITYKTLVQHESRPQECQPSKEPSLQHSSEIYY